MNNRKKFVSILAGIMAAVMLLTLILSLIPANVSAASSSEIKKQINQLKEDKKALQAQMEEVQGQYEENENEILDTVNKKSTIDQEISLLYDQIDLVNQELSSYSLLIADKQDELDAAQGRLSELNAKNKERIRAMEEDGSISYWAVLFKASSFSDLLDRLNMIEEIAASDQRRLKEMSAAAEEVEAAREALTVEKDELEVAREELDAIQLTLEEKKAEAQELLNELIAYGEELNALFEGFELEEEALMDEIAQKEKEYNEAKHQEWLAYMATYTTVPPATKPPASNSGSSGGSSGGSTSNGSGTASSSGWLVPCSYTKLTSPFGNRDTPTAGASTFHKGVDLAGPEGTPIYASRSGVVTVATHSKSAGNYVTINHGDGFSSVYMHMTKYVVKKGAAVSAGQLIGYMGSTGISTGPHLHFGITKDGTYVNPANYVNLHA